MMLFGSLSRNEQREDNYVDVCVEILKYGIRVY